MNSAPDDVLAVVLAKLNGSALIRLATVSQQWRRVILCSNGWERCTLAAQRLQPWARRWTLKLVITAEEVYDQYQPGWQRENMLGMYELQLPFCLSHPDGEGEIEWELPKLLGMDVCLPQRQDQRRNDSGDSLTYIAWDIQEARLVSHASGSSIILQDSTTSYDEYFPGAYSTLQYSFGWSWRRLRWQLGWPLRLSDLLHIILCLLRHFAFVLFQTLFRSKATSVFSQHVSVRMDLDQDGDILRAVTLLVYPATF